MTIHPYCSFDTHLVGDTALMLIDRSEPFFASMTNDADQVVRWLDQQIEGGIGSRKVYYRDTYGHFDQLSVKNGHFDGFKACTVSQQAHFRSLYNSNTVTL